MTDTINISCLDQQVVV
jgi:hypothetical protein